MPSNRVFLEDLKLASRRDAVIKKLYSSCKQQIRELGSRFGYPIEESDDILQDAIIVLWRKLNAEEFRFQADPSTFIYAVAKNKFFKIARSQKKLVKVDLCDIEPSSEEELIDEELHQERHTKMIQVLDEIGERCRSLITEYYLGMSMTELAVKHNYSSTANAINQRYKCMERMRTKVAKLIKITHG